MAGSCSSHGCKLSVPSQLESEKLCVMHFTLRIEKECAEMRRETALGNAPHARQVEIIRWVAEHGEILARVATCGMQMENDMKARILSTFLTLMNLRENLDRAALRAPTTRAAR